MAIVFSAFVPHPPQALPSVGGAQADLLKATVASLGQLEQDLYVAKPDTLLLISPHGSLLPEAVTIHFGENFTVDFQQFGDLKTRLEFLNDVELAYLLRERCETSFPLHATAETKLDYGAAVPLYFLAQHLKSLRLIVIHPSLLSLAQHNTFGQKIQGQLKETNRRVAVIASGDLSHRHTAQAPGGFSRQAKPFDEFLVTLLKNHQTSEVLSIADETRKEAGECGLASLAILLGIMEGMQYKIEVLSYEAPLGVGLLAAEFRLS